MPSRSFRGIDQFPAVFERVSGGHFTPRMFTRVQRCERLRHVPFPRRRDVNEVEIIARNEFFKISFAVRVNRRRLLTSLFDELRRTRTFVSHDVAHRHSPKLTLQLFSTDLFYAFVGPLLEVTVLGMVRSAFARITRGVVATDQRPTRIRTAVRIRTM